MSLSARLMEAGFAAGLIHPPRFFQRLYRFPWYGGTLLDWALTVVDERAGRSSGLVLELGSGPGDLSGALAQRGADVIGVDQSQAMIGIAKRRFGNVAGLGFQVGDATKLDFRDGQFKAVISVSLINVVPDAGAMLVEMARLLAPHGKASVLFPTPAFTREKAQVLACDMQIGPWSAAGMRTWAKMARKLEAEQVSALFEAAGFEAIEQVPYLDGALTSVTGAAPAK